MPQRFCLGETALKFLSGMNRAEEQWRSLEESVRAWMVFREWSIESQLSFFRQTRALSARERLSTLATMLAASQDDNNVALLKKLPKMPERTDINEVCHFVNIKDS